MTASGGRLRPEVLATALQPWADTGQVLHRRLLDFGNVEDGWEVLWVGPGAARAATWWASRSSAHVHAVDPSPAAIGWAERAARSAGLGGRVSLQEGHADDLPHTEAVFDLVIAMLLFDPATDPVEALQQASRVVRPMCSVVAAAPVWPGTPPTGVETMIGAIGVRPRFLTAWKQAAREAGLVEVTAETALPSRPWLSAGLVGIVARGWYAAGLEGARTVLSAPVRTFRHLVRTRALDLAVVRGVRWPTE